MFVIVRIHLFNDGKSWSPLFFTFEVIHEEEESNHKKMQIRQRNCVFGIILINLIISWDEPITLTYIKC